MAKNKQDPEREERIRMEIVADAHDAEEVATSWYYHLDDTLRFPFTANCIAERAISPLRKGDEVEVLEIGPGDECAHEMFVGIRWERRSLAVPLSQLEPIDETDEETTEAVADWHYWRAQGYEF